MAQSYTKQPSEKRVLTIGFPADNVGDPLPTLSTVTMYASWISEPLASATLQASADKGDTSVDLSVDPGVGAFLIITPGITHDTVKVSAVSGVGPFTCTITPALAFAHADDAPVSYEPGVSDAFFVGVPTLSQNKVAFSVEGGADQQTYRVSAIAVDTLGERREGEIDVLVEES